MCGDWSGAFALLEPLHAAGYRLLLLPETETLARYQPAVALVVYAAGAGETFPSKMMGADGRLVPWVCWNRPGRPGLALAAYRAGALAVLPATATGAELLQGVRHALAALIPLHHPLPSERRYLRDELIALDRDAVLEVREGVVAQAVIYADGTEVLLGLCGPGQLLVGHPADGCCLNLVAHSDTRVIVRNWGEAAAQPGFAERLRARLRQMEAWSAAQARHYLDQRVLGILDLLAGQFGLPRDEGVVIDVRITHAQLAAAVGATRTTITRILGDLRGRGLLLTVGTGPGERFCLLGWAGDEHDR